MRNDLLHMLHPCERLVRRNSVAPQIPADVARGEPSPGADVARGEPSPGADVARGQPSPGADVARGEPSPGADVARASRVQVQMWPVRTADSCRPHCASAG
jgi:hypothetical protein